MTGLKQLAIVVLGSVVAGGMIMLGVWQLRVYTAQGLEVAQQRASGPPVRLDQVASAGQQVRDGYGRRVNVEGRYLPEQQLLVPASDDSGRVRVLTAFEQADGTVVAVVRGVIADPGPGTAAPEPPTGQPPTGQLSQTGVLLPSEEAGTGLPDAGRLASVRVAVLAQQWTQPLVDGYLLLSAEDSSAQGLQPAPLILQEQPGRLRNGAYALQWWIFAAFALVMAGRVAGDVGRRSEIVSASTGSPT